MKTESHPDPADPRTTHLSIDPEWHCDGCPKYAKCRMRQDKRQDKCDKARGRER